MSVRLKIWALPIVASAIFAIGIVVVVFSSIGTMNTITDVGRNSYPYLQATNQLAAQLETLSTTIEGAVAAGEKARMDDAGERVAQIQKTLAGVANLTGHEERVAALKKDFDAYAGTAVDAAQMLLGIKPGDGAAALPLMQAAQKALGTRLKTEQGAAQTEFRAALQSAEGGVRSSLWATVISGAVVVAVLGVASWLVIGSIWKQLGGEPEYARQAMRAMAQGDLSQQILVASGDETSLLATVNAMAQGLRDMVSGVRTSTFQITDASREIAAGNGDLSQRTENQASSLARTASNMERLTSTVQQNADSARTANDLAITASNVASQGGEAVNEVTQTMRTISTSSRQIADIIGVIDGIAFQTNILALNAAVEAARAGEQGRGFAVVASEVRNLAQRSSQAAKEISALINTSVTQVEHGSSLVDRAGATMREVVTSVQRVSDIIAEITRASMEQASGIAEASSDIARMDDTTQQNAALVEQAAAAATSLQHQAGLLTEAVSTFKLGA